MSEILITVVANVDGEDVFVGEYTSVESMEEDIYKIERAVK